MLSTPDFGAAHSTTRPIEKRAARPGARRRLRGAYVAAALTVVNAGLLFLALNALALVWVSWRESRTPAVVDLAPVRSAYPQLGEDDARELVRESERAKAYEPFTEFKERATTGRFVNVDPNGFRVGTDQGPWPPSAENFNVFVFGGSTTFGYGVTDDDAVPSILQQLLTADGRRPVRVYNFGRGAYYSTQERILFEQLIAKGNVPAVAIFIDGLNDFYSTDDRPALTQTLEEFVDRQGQPSESPYLSILRGLPLARAVAPLKSAVLGPRPATSDRPTADEGPIVRGVLDRYLANKRIAQAVAEAYGIGLVFVWQPVPMYRFDLRYHATALNPGHRYVPAGYHMMARRKRREHALDDLVWCADIQRGIQKPLYVDSCHYTPWMARRVARCIADAVRSRGVLG